MLWSLTAVNGVDDCPQKSFEYTPTKYPLPGSKPFCFPNAETPFNCSYVIIGSGSCDPCPAHFPVGSSLRRRLRCWYGSWGRPQWPRGTTEEPHL